MRTSQKKKAVRTMAESNGTKGLPGVMSEAVYAIPLKDIHADYAWNARNSAWMSVTVGPDEDCGPNESRGISGLVDAIRARGQDTPIWVCMTKESAWLKGKNVKAEYFAVSGFRRLEAIRRIAEADGNKNPTVNAIVRAYKTEAEARAANLRENVDRDDLSGPDLAFGVAELTLKLGMPAMHAAQELGRSQSYVNKLHTIMKNVTGHVETVKTEVVDGKEVQRKTRMPIVQAWRESLQPIPVMKMHELSQCPVERQEEEYLKVALKAGKVTNGGNWLANAEAQAIKAGARMGLLQFEGVIDTDARRIAQGVRSLVKFKEEATGEQITKVIAALKAGYAEGKKGPGVEEEEAAETESPKKGRKGKQAEAEA